MAEEATIAVQVVHARPRRHWVVDLQVPAGTTVGEAIAMAGLEREVPELDVDPQRLAIFGRSAAMDEVLAAGDRVEILRPLLADPKDVRRRRALGR